MTRLLEQAFTEAGKLPEADQDTFAKWLLAEIESERAWQESFARSGSVLKQLADEALEEHLRGETEDLDPDQL
jgi:hypothetical protein